jgi:hypothetical protein
MTLMKLRLEEAMLAKNKKEDKEVNLFTDEDLMVWIDDDIFEKHGKKIRNDNWVIRCPVHGEKTPSLSVNRQFNQFHCIVCGINGTYEDLLKLLENGATHEKRIHEE